MKKYVKLRKRRKIMDSKKRAIIEHNEFANWYFFNNLEADGLIKTATAAELLNVKMPYVYQLGKEGRIRRYTYNNPKKKKETTYYSLSDVMKIVVEKESIYKSHKYDDADFTDSSKYPEKEKWSWLLADGATKKYVETKYKQWAKKNPEEAKRLKEEAKFSPYKDLERMINKEKEEKRKKNKKG
jgi:hypothetical protein